MLRKGKSGFPGVNKLGIVLFAVLSVVVLAGAVSQLAYSNRSPIIVAAGDIACSPNDPNFNDGNGANDLCQMKATSRLVDDPTYSLVLALGDNQYSDGALDKFKVSYDPTWGRVKDRTRPVPGNHDYGPGETIADGYFDYFGAAAGEPPGGWYSFDVGEWHLIALNSNCPRIEGGCDGDSPQGRWLAADLAAHSAECTLAYFHGVRFSSGAKGQPHGAFWNILYDAGADVILGGHKHNYERFAPQAPDGTVDPERGIRQFVVGSGGVEHGEFHEARGNSEVFDNETYGVLQLALNPGSYDWKFIPVAGETFSDEGSDDCH